MYRKTYIDYQKRLKLVTLELDLTNQGSPKRAIQLLY